MAIRTASPENRTPGSVGARAAIGLAVVTAAIIGHAGLWRGDLAPHSRPGSGHLQLMVRLDRPALLMNISWGGRQ